ncbi:MAG: anti-sigma factor [Bdellovibrionales bacterium]|nr:anti-sigma factor [Bdellovibrionales bacterium]
MKLCYVKMSLSLLGGVMGLQIASGGSIDFKSATGKVLIAAPTEVNGPTNQGVWFISPASKSFSLDLPDLPENQVYEGWLVDDCTGKKISTGLFRSSGGIDSDAAGKFAGPLALNFPQVPGSDFVTLGHNLADGGHNVVITVEPYPDFDPNPSGLAVLKVKIPEDSAAGAELTFDNIAQ